LHADHIDLNWKNDSPENIRTLCGSCHLKAHWHETNTHVQPKKMCTLCDKPHRGRGYCTYHLNKWRRLGYPTTYGG